MYFGVDSLGSIGWVYFHGIDVEAMDAGVFAE